MKRTFWAPLLLAVFGMTFCCGGAPVKSAAQQKREMVDLIEHKTIALVIPTEEDLSVMKPYCSGVWVDDDKILTAFHCVNDNDLLIYEVVGDEDGIVRMTYLSDVDPDNDLALLVTDPRSTPKHPVAKIADVAWDGEHVNIVGHTSGLWWTFIEGVVSSTRASITNDKGKLPKSIQVSSPAWFGNSGGGAFDDDGKLVGISSWISTRAPMMSFFIHRDALFKFLSKKTSGP